MCYLWIKGEKLYGGGGLGLVLHFEVELLTATGEVTKWKTMETAAKWITSMRETTSLLTTGWIIWILAIIILLSQI